MNITGPILETFLNGLNDTNSRHTAFILRGPDYGEKFSIRSRNQVNVIYGKYKLERQNLWPGYNMVKKYP